MLWIPVECFSYFLYYVLMNVVENIHVYAYINLSYMIENLVCIISNHHCVIFIIPIEFLHSKLLCKLMLQSKCLRM